MAYIDLNPIRAGMSATPDQSDYTSIQMRIEYWKQKANNSTDNNSSDENFQPDSLMPFACDPRQPMPSGLPYNLIAYLDLVDWSGRAIREDKSGAIDESLPPILQRLNIGREHWLGLCTNFESRFKGLVGSVQSVRAVLSNFGLTRKANFRNSKLLFG